MLGIAMLGAMLAAAFGVIHDQVTFTISSEYFTRMKFLQFRLEGSSLPARIKVAWIGVLATWWVGFIAAWFMARRFMTSFEGRQLLGKVLRGLAGMLLATVACGLLGAWLGPPGLADREGWRDALETMAITDSAAFLRVAGIHLGSYAGAIVGFLGVMWPRSRPEPKKPRSNPADLSD